MNIEQLKYPIDAFVFKDVITKSEIENAIKTIGDFPKLIRHETEGLSSSELQKNTDQAVELFSSLFIIALIVIWIRLFLLKVAAQVLIIR
tara:strand:- start:60 stop:329 length:270 start_codon:yes stop_codon:yes gene_type:complete